MRHKFIPISKQEYTEKNLLEETTRIENVTHEAARLKKIPFTPWLYTDAINFRHSAVVGWYHPYAEAKEFPAGSFRKPVRKLTELLGFKPVTHQTFCYLTAIWAFRWDSHEVLLFKSVRGVTIQVMPDFPHPKIKDFYDDLIEVLKAGKHPLLVKILKEENK